MVIETGNSLAMIAEMERKRRLIDVYSTASGGNWSFGVEVGAPGSGSHWDPNRRKYHYDGEILFYPEDEMMGVVQHEDNHELVSDLEPVMDMWQELGFSFVYNAAEDPRANQGGMKQKPGTRSWIRAYIERDLGKGGGLDYKNIKKDTEGKMGYCPAYMKAGCEVIRYWYEREFSGKIANPREPAKFTQDFQQFLDGIPKDVNHKTKEEEAIINFMKSMQPHFETYFNTIPPSKDEKERFAAESAEVFKKGIWPEAKKLVDQSLKDQSMVDWLKDQMKQKGQQGQQGGMPQPGGQGGGGGGQVIMIPFDALPDEVKQEIREKMKEHTEQKRREKQQQGQQAGGGQPGKQQPKPGEKAGGGQPQPGEEMGGAPQAGGPPQGEEKEGEEAGVGGGTGTEKPEEKEAGEDGGKEGEKKTGEEAGGTGEKGKKEAAGKPGGEGKEGEEGEEQVPWDKLSDKAKKEIEKVFDGKGDKDEIPKVTEEERKKHRDNAQKELEDVEDKANEKIQGKTMEKQPDTHGERRTIEIENQKQERQREADKKVDDMARREAEAKKRLKGNPYNEFRAMPEVDNMIKIWKSKFNFIFEPTANPAKRLKDTGLTLSLRGARQRAANRAFSKVWEDREKPKEKSYRFTILVDLSGSMKDYKKIDETFKMIVAFSEVMNAYGIEFEIMGFTDSFPHDVKVYKPFEKKKMDDIDRLRLNELYSDCVLTGAGTPTLEATIAAYKRLKERIKRRPMENNFFITLTDGQCTTSSPKDVVEAIEKIIKERLSVPAGLGIGRETQFVNKSYPPLPQPVRRKIASVLGLDFESVDNSFPDIVNFSKAFPVIIDYMIDQPGLFFRQKRTP